MKTAFLSFICTAAIGCLLGFIFYRMFEVTLAIATMGAFIVHAIEKTKE